MNFHLHCIRRHLSGVRRCTRAVQDGEVHGADFLPREVNTKLFFQFSGIKRLQKATN